MNKIVSVCGPYTEGLRKFRIVVVYEGGERKSHHFTTIEKATSEITKFQNMQHEAHQQAIADLGDMPPYDKENLYQWWKDILAWLTQKLILTHDPNLRATLTAVSTAAKAVRELDKTEETRAELQKLINTLKEKGLL